MIFMFLEEGGSTRRRLREENARLRQEVEELRLLLGPDALVLTDELQSTRDALTGAFFFVVFFTEIYTFFSINFSRMDKYCFITYRYVTKTNI
jgi:hypothetical protein